MADEHIFKPKLLKGLIFGIFLSGWSGCLAIGLALIAIDLSFGVLKVLAFGASFFAALVMIFFFYWVLCFLKLRYTVKDNNLTVHWGLVAHVIPLSSITRISVTGYSDDVLVDMFSWPGMGQLILQAVLREDIPVAMATFSFLGIFALVAHFLADVSYAYLDPRIRIKSQG